MTSPRLFHIGSAVVDYVYRIAALPVSGGESIASEYSLHTGGGFNMMAAAARAGMRVCYGGGHGTGPNGDFLRAAFAVEQIEVLASPSSELDSGNCVVMVTGDAERTFVSWPGAEGLLRTGMLDRIAAGRGDWVFTSGYPLCYPGSRDVITDWIETLPAEVQLVFDPAPVVADIPRSHLSRVLSRVNWLSCNRGEAETIAGSGDPADLAERIFAVSCRAADGVVVRIGAEGCFLRLAEGTGGFVPGFPVAALDTNGAGDCHIGAFVAALARGDDPMAAARYANAAAAISTTRRGGSSAPDDREIRSFLGAGPDRPKERSSEETINS